ncbi:hypothetical protein COBT_003678 [Conglomerata obtusa]
MPGEMKRNTALDYPRPHSFGELRRFLELVQLNYLIGKIHEDAFMDLKYAIRKIKNFKLPEYNKQFVLKTDASNTGLGAVLLQKDEKNRLVPIQWSSKNYNTDRNEIYNFKKGDVSNSFWN